MNDAAAEKGRSRYWMLGLAILQFAIFAGVGENGFVLDAEVIVRDDRRILDFDIPAIFRGGWWDSADPRVDGNLYRPLTQVFLALVARVSHEAEAFNLAALLVHLAVGTLRFALLVRLLRGMAARRPVAFCIVALAGTHVAAAESVVGIVGIAESLCALLTTASWLAFTRGLDRERPGSGRLWLVLSAVFWLAALLCKESAALFPVVLLVQGLLDLPRGDDQVPFAHRVRAMLLPAAAFAVAGAVWLGLRSTALGTLADFGTSGVYADFTTRERLASALAAAGGLILPSLIFPHAIIANVTHQDVAPTANFFDPRVLAGILVFGGLATWSVLLLVRRRVAGLFGLYALSSWLVTANLVLGIGAIAAHRFLYQPLFGLAAGAVLGTLALLRWKPVPGRTAMAALAVIGLVGIVQTLRVIPKWKDAESLASWCRELNPRSIWALHNLVAARHLSGKGSHDFEAMAKDLAQFDGIEKDMTRVPSLGKPDAGSRYLAFQILINQANNFADRAAGLLVAAAASGTDSPEAMGLLARAKASTDRAANMAQRSVDRLEARLNYVQILFLELRGILGSKTATVAERDASLRNLQVELGGARLLIDDSTPVAVHVRWERFAAQEASLRRQPKEQLYHLEQAMALAPGDPELRMELAMLAASGGQFARALEHLDAAIGGGQAGVETYALAVELADRMSQPERAIDYARRGLKAPLRNSAAKESLRQLTQRLQRR